MALSEADRVDSAEIRSEVKRGVQNAFLRMAARLAVNATVETTHEDAQDDVWASMEELESIDQLFKELEEADKTCPESCQSFKNLVAVIDVDGRDEPLVIEATRDPGYESWTYPDISGWGDPGPMPKHGPSELISNKAQAQADRQSDYLPIPLQVGGFWPKPYK
jgi:hypothetical protein